MHLKDCQYAYEKVKSLLCDNNSPSKKTIQKASFRGKANSVRYERLIPKARFLG